MKKINVILLITIWAFSAFSLERWEVYTNTSHIYQTLLNDSELISASWGGIEEYNISDSSEDLSIELKNKYTTINGLSSNEVRTIFIQNNKLWAGTYNDGVSIIDDGKVFLINADTGLLSNKVIAIKAIGELVFVVTEGGFSTFYTLDEISFPILSRKYSETSTAGALASDTINDIIVYQDYIFLATDDGLTYFPVTSLDNFNEWETILSINSSLANNKVNKLAVYENQLTLVQNNTIQVVSDFFTNPNWETYIIPGAEDNQASISAVNHDAEGNVIFATGVWSEELTTMSELSSSILQMIDKEGNIQALLTSDSPIYKLNNDGQTSQLTRISEIGIQSIDLVADKIILSTWGAGIFIYENSNWYQLEPNGIGFNAINFLTVDQNHHLWASCGYYGINALRKGARGVSTLAGSDWTSYNMSNSPLQSDNINSITVGLDNKKWFGSWYASPEHPQNWQGGATYFDEENNKWRLYSSRGVFDYNSDTESYSDLLSNIPKLPSQTVSYLNTDLKGNIMMSLQSYGIAFFSPNGDERLAISPLYGSTAQFTRLSFNNEFGYFFSKSASAAGESAGLLHWDSQELPQDGNISNWSSIPVSEIRSSVINDMIEVSTPYGKQMWIAGNNGLYMYNGNDWYRYGIDIKREIWSGSNWAIDTRYIVGETKLFAAQETHPTALAIDDYGCLWIGSDSAGLTKFDTNTEEYFIYDKASYPLISDQITALAYEAQSGKLFIGAAEGLCSLTVGSSINTQKDFNKVVAVPNPFYPERGDIVRIFNEPGDFMPNSAKVCKIFDKSGQLVYDIPLNKYQSFSWDGNNKKGKKCSSGVYFFVISNNNGETVKGKIALIRN